MSKSMVVQMLLLILGLGSAAKVFAQNEEASVSSSEEVQIFSNNYRVSDLEFNKHPGQLNLFWKSELYGQGAELKTQSSQVGGLKLSLEGQYNLLESLKAVVSLQAKYESGRSQSFFGDLEPNTGIFAREAVVVYSPFQFIDIKAGVISQNWLDLPILIDRQTFPGGQVDIHVTTFDHLTTGLNAQSLIPTSQTLSSRTIDREATPTFQTQMAYVKWDDKKLEVEQVYGRYDYDNLPSIVAWNSVRYGNDPARATAPFVSSFLYDFSGWFTRTTIGYRVSSLWQPWVYLNVVKNTKAPETYNDAQSIGIGSHFYTSNYQFTLIAEHFFVESETVPAIYNSWAHGNTNKEGDGIEFHIAFLKKKFRIRGQYFQYKPINTTDSFQQDLQYFYLGVETGYDKI